MAVPLRGVLLMGWWWRFAGSGVIGKSVATVKVFFIARISLYSQLGDRPFLAAMAGMAVTSRGVAGGLGVAVCGKRCDRKICCDRQSLFYRSNWPD
jgi:hypothetical protein